MSPPEGVSAWHVAPWVTLWSDEVVKSTDIRLKPGYDRVRYVDERPDDWFMGVLWERERIGRSGGPLFREVHARRQRRCMVDPRCQVCGDRFAYGKTSTQGVAWLMPKWEFKMLRSQPEMTTTTPPTCERCWHIAEFRCPHLRARGTVRFFADIVEPWGVFGQLYHPLIQRRGEVAKFNTIKARHMIAKQLIVKIDNIVEVGDGLSQDRGEADQDHRQVVSTGPHDS